MNSAFDGLSVGAFDWSHAHSYIEVNGTVAELDWSCGSGELWHCDNEFGSWQLQFKRISGSKAEFGIHGKLKQNADHIRLCVAEIPEISCDHLLVSGLKMGGCRGMKLPLACDTDNPNMQEVSIHEFTSYYTCAISRGTETLMITTPLAQPQWGMVRGKIEGNTLKNLFVGCEIEYFGGTEIETPVFTLTSGSGFARLAEYADENTATKRDFSTPPECGWNSWDYYRWTITEDEVLKNAEFIAKDPVLKQHVRRIIVDDGWQYCYGEWDANSLFPSGMKALADNLKKMNFIPGLWLAPSIVEPHARIAQLGYDMLACSVGGQPTLCYECMKRVGFVLDPTVKKSRKFLKELFDRYCQYGYEYFKLDFLARTTSAPRFADASIPRSQIVNKLMEPIIEGVNGRAFVMGCNYPFSTTNRYVSSVRVGGDIHADWQNIKVNTASVACRYWMNKKLWINDPDFSLCRGVDTSDYPETLKCVLVYTEPQMEFSPWLDKTFGSARIFENQVSLSIALMAGGAINLSDDVTKLNEAGLDLARKVVSAESGEAAIPLDLFASSLPRIWKQRLSHGGRLLLVNWEDEPQEIRPDKEALDGIPARVTDFWKGESIARPAEVVLEPHHCLLLQW